MILLWLDHLLAILFGLGWPLAAVAGRGRVAEPLEPPEKIQTYWWGAVNLLVPAAIVVGHWWWRGRGMADLGLGPPRPGSGFESLALTAFFVVWMGLDSWWHLRSPGVRRETAARWRRDTPFMPANGRELAHSTVLAVAAGVGEEIVFRGYLIWYLATLLGPGGWSVPVAVALPAVVCGAAHLYQGPLRAAKTGILAVLMGALLVASGSLWLPITLHVALDLAMSAIGVRWLMGRPEAAVPTDRGEP